MIICFSLLGQTAKGQEITSPKGVMKQMGGCSAECCFGRMITFFFEDGNCVHRSIDEMEDRLVYFGTWKLEGSKIKIHYHTRFYGKPIGEKVVDYNRCSEERYSLYTAVKESINISDSLNWDEEKKSVSLITSGYRSPTSDYHKFRANLSQFNFLSTDVSFDKQKIYSEQYLARLSKVELRLLRNGIFAKYGLVFKDKELTNYFKTGIYEGVRMNDERINYEGLYNDVTAFLNEHDKANIELITKFENAK